MNWRAKIFGKLDKWAQAFFDEKNSAFYLCVICTIIAIACFVGGFFNPIFFLFFIMFCLLVALLLSEYLRLKK